MVRNRIGSWSLPSERTVSQMQKWSDSIMKARGTRDKGHGAAGAARVQCFFEPSSWPLDVVTCIGSSPPSARHVEDITFDRCRSWPYFMALWNAVEGRKEGRKEERHKQIGVPDRSFHEVETTKLTNVGLIPLF